MLCVVFRKVASEKVLPHISQYGGTVMNSSLASEVEAQLQSTLAEGAKPKIAASVSYSCSLVKLPREGPAPSCHADTSML